MRVVFVYTFVLLAISIWSSCAQTDATCSGGGSDAGNPCRYNSGQGLGSGCENIDRCRQGAASPFYCCAAVAQCASINLYAYKDNPEYFVMCACGKFLIVPCPEDHEFDPVLNRCKHRKTGLLRVVINLATGVLQS